MYCISNTMYTWYPTIYKSITTRSTNTQNLQICKSTTQNNGTLLHSQQQSYELCSLNPKITTSPTLQNFLFNPFFPPNRKEPEMNYESKCAHQNGVQWLTHDYENIHERIPASFSSTTQDVLVLPVAGSNPSMLACPIPNLKTTAQEKNVDLVTILFPTPIWGESAFTNPRKERPECPN